MLTIKQLKYILFLSFICFLPSAWAADENNNQTGESCASNAEVCPSDFTKFDDKLTFLGYTKASISPVAGKNNTYQLTIKGVPSSLSYICCDKSTNTQSQKSIDVNEILKQWHANDKSDLIAIVDPVRKKFKFIFLVSQANFNPDKKELVLIVSPGKDSASVPSNFAQPLNAGTSLMLMTKQKYDKYHY